jgi:hypothetical protein
MSRAIATTGSNSRGSSRAPARAGQSQLDAINAANLERFPQWKEILKNARFSSEVVDFQTT